MKRRHYNSFELPGLLVFDQAGKVTFHCRKYSPRTTEKYHRISAGMLLSAGCCENRGCEMTLNRSYLVNMTWRWDRPC